MTLLLLVICVGLLAVLLRFTETDAPREARQDLPTAASTRTPKDATGTRGDGVSSKDPEPGGASSGRKAGRTTDPPKATTTTSGIDLGHTGPPLPDDREAANPDPRFRGTGTLRGFVEADGEVAFPERWTLVAEPSRVFPGREFAEERRIEFEVGEREFELRNLPLGGYDLSAIAEGHNALRMPVLLDVSQPDAYVVLRFLPAARLSGRVLEAGGLPAAEVALTLVTLSDRSELPLFTDELGGFAFGGLADGAYELVIGSPLSPTVPPRALRLTSPGMVLPDIELPPLVTLDIVVSAWEDQRLLMDASLRGSSPAGGSFEATTNSYGRASLRWLKPGRWRVSTSMDGYSSRRDTLDLAPGEARTIVIELLP